MVASYPYDDSEKHQRQGFYSATPDDDFYVHVAKIYSDNHPIMHLEQPCNGDTFEGGITNGADWYDVPGGNYKLYHNVSSVVEYLYLVLSSLVMLVFT